MARWYRALAKHRKLTRYDNRGLGLSDSLPRDFSLEAQVKDLEAVVSGLAADKVDLIGTYTSGPAAMLYALRHPDRVAHLLLWCTFARGKDYEVSPLVASIRGLLPTWDIYTETGAHSFVGWAAGDASHEIAHLMREASTPEVAKAFFAVLSQIDLLEELPKLKVPTLVLHPRSLPLVDLGLARHLASTIPNATLRVVDGESMSPWRCEFDAICFAIDEFLGESPTDSRAGLVERERLLPENPDKLSEREIEVLSRLASGLSNREIAEDLVLSVRTVERHVANAYSKAKVSGRAQATAYALKHQLL
jgi:pimeloyl-ACP methyl ester carboxylesterase/DNA-binding CsgD family transcriptional regulator